MGCIALDLNLGDIQRIEAHVFCNATVQLSSICAMSQDIVRLCVKCVDELEHCKIICETCQYLLAH